MTKQMDIIKWYVFIIIICCLTCITKKKVILWNIKKNDLQQTFIVIVPTINEALNFRNKIKEKS